MASVSENNKTSTGNGTSPSAPSNDSVVETKDTQNLLPHLESLERIIKLPVVGAAWDKSQDVYGKVKGNFSQTVANDNGSIL